MTTVAMRAIPLLILFATSCSMILYLDGKQREFRGDSCTGSQSSRRLDSRTIDILLNCPSGEWFRLTRLSSSLGTS